MKECKRCGLTCELHERDKNFYRNGTTVAGAPRYNSYCRPCQKALDVEYRRNKKDQRNQEVTEDTVRLTPPAIVRTGWPFTA